MTMYINKDESNTLIFTLNESTTIIGVRYILEIFSKATTTTKIMWLNDDLSVNPERFNKYIIEEVPLADEDLEDIKINLQVGGYSFFVWQTESDILSLDEADDIIESGAIQVLGEEPVINIATVTPSTKHTFE